RYELQFETQMTNYNVTELYKEVLLPRAASIGFKLVHFLTLKFLEIRATSSRGKKTDLGSHYIRSAIEAHSQNSPREDTVNFLLDLLRDAWEALLKVNRAEA